MVGEQTLKDALFTVHHHKGDRFAPFADRVGYALKLMEFAGWPRLLLQPGSTGGIGLEVMPLVNPASKQAGLPISDCWAT
jgi:hypothetical protein